MICRYAGHLSLAIERHLAIRNTPCDRGGAGRGEGGNLQPEGTFGKKFNRASALWRS